MSKACILPMLALLCVPTHANAQKPADSFDQLQGSLKKGDVVYVENDARAGERVKGTVIEISPSSLIVETRSVARGRNVFPAGGTSAFPAERVLQITRVDRRLNGFLFGLAAGVGVGAWGGWGYVNQLCVNEVGACPGLGARCCCDRLSRRRMDWLGNRHAH